MIDWLNPYRWLLLGALAAAIVFGIPILWERHSDAQQEIGYQRRADEDKAAADAQTTNNRELGRMAELRLSALRPAQERFFTKASKEIHDASAPLAACLVPEPVRLRLNAARTCASGDSAAACGTDDEMPAAR